MYDLAPCHKPIRTRTFFECKEIPVLKWPGNWLEIITIKNVWNITKKEIGNQLPCLKEET